MLKQIKFKIKYEQNIAKTQVENMSKILYTN